jgi:photosystem II stability/assembly factor-like uncharacterized protein
MRRILLLLLLSGFAVQVLSQEYWQRVPSPTTKWLYQSYFVDSVYGWAVGDSGAIVHTSNGGANWALQNSGIQNYPIDDIFFVNRTTGWALANDYLFFGTIVLRTTNGGLNWTNARFYDTSAVLSTVYFFNQNVGFMSGYTGRVFKTTNGGSNWFDTRIDTSFCSYLYLFPKVKFDFLNAQTGYVCGGQIDIQGIIWKTTDSGLNWFTYCVTPEPLADIKAINSNKVISSGGDFEYGAITAQTSNSGSIWHYDTTGFFGIGKNLAFRTPSELWLPLAFAQTWAVNLDSGSINSSWYRINAPDSTSVYAAEFVSPVSGWAFGSYGAIMKYNSSVIGILENQVPSQLTLFQNYPNPFNPSTTISYQLVKPEFVKITVYDLLGKQVRLIIEGMKPAGLNKFKFVNMNLASGVYIYKVEAGKFSEMKKMVLLK